MNSYDVERIFAEIEESIIQALINQFRKDRAKGNVGSYEWKDWRIRQLKAIKEFIKTQKGEHAPTYKLLNDSINNLINKSFSDSIERAVDVAEEDPFHTINRTRVDALIEATTNDLSDVESAVFRKTEDAYRQIVYKAQMSLNSGLVTYDQAVDMATKDFLSSGINCVVYKNGSRHTVREYAQMVLRTATKRAALMADGEMRTRTGIHTVYAVWRDEACPKCMEYLGRLMVDDVYSNGTKAEAKKLKCITLSEAMEGGFLHPNCKDYIRTYDPKRWKNDPKNDPLKKTISKRERYQMSQRYNAEMQLNGAKQTEEKYKRLAKNSLDKENVLKYRSYEDRWHSEVAKIRENAQSMRSLDEYRDIMRYDKRGLDKINEVERLTREGGLDAFKDFARNEPIEWSCYFSRMGGKDRFGDIDTNFSPHECEINYVDDYDLFLGIHAHNHPVYRNWSVNVLSPPDIEAALLSGVREEYAVWYGGEHRLINNNVLEYLEDEQNILRLDQAYNEYLYDIRRERFIVGKEYETQFAQDYHDAYEQFIREAEDMASEKYLEALGMEHGWDKAFGRYWDENIDRVFENLTDEQLEEWLRIKETYIEERCEQWLKENASIYNCLYEKTLL